MKITLKKKTVEVPALASKVAFASAHKFPEAVSRAVLSDPPSPEKAAAILDAFCPDLTMRHFFYAGYASSLVMREAVQRGAVSAKPYDLVLLYDVLDHVKEPSKLLGAVRSNMRQGATLMVRCHPWTARDAKHLAGAWNKAYLHYMFDEDELEKVALYGKRSRKETADIAVYRAWFEEAEFEILYEEPIVRTSEKFFDQPPFNDHLDSRKESVQFVDYILEAK